MREDGLLEHLIAEEYTPEILAKMREFWKLAARTGFPRQRTGCSRQARQEL